MLKRKRIFLLEGQFVVVNTPTEIVTILGSCVAVCLWDRRRKIAGMNHFLLPGDLESKEAGHPNRGISSTRMLIKSMLNRNCQTENIEAKLFGGCDSLYQFPIGEKNVEMAMHVLKEANIHLVAAHTGGNVGRKIIFDSTTGKVLMRLQTLSVKEKEEAI